MTLVEARAAARPASPAATGDRPHRAVKPVPAGAEDAAVETIARAFLGDPVANWAWPEEQQRYNAMQELAHAFGGAAFDHDGAFCTEGMSGVALWLPLGAHPDEDRMIDVIMRTVSPLLRDDVFGTFEQMSAFHPQEPHWHLPLIGVHPAHQGQGLGDALLAHTLAFCDRAGVLAYLEASSARSVPLYRRHGFESIGTIQAGSSPTLVPMVRKPR